MATISQPLQSVNYEQATSDRRLIARLIDLVIGVAIMSTAGGCLTALIMMPFSKELDNKIFGWLFASITLLLLIAYDTIMHWRFGKTFGKMILGLRVVDSKGENLNWQMSLLRAVLLYVMGTLIVFLTVVTYSIVGWIFLMGLSRYKRFPHDSATHAFVVREVKSPAVKEAGPVIPPTPLADLERLRLQGIISQEEFERKKSQIKA